MSFAGHILDMIKRIRQNRSLRPSKRQKFKEQKEICKIVKNRGLTPFFYGTEPSAKSADGSSAPICG